ncbi:MAG: hypothetical protein PVI94_27745 [Desulfobacterales bacterium]
MIHRIGLSSILLKLLIEEERVETAIVPNPAFAAVVIRAVQADRNNRQLHGMTFVTDSLRSYPDLRNDQNAGDNR